MSDEQKDCINYDNTQEVFEIISNSSLNDFLKNEKEIDVEIIFSEIASLTHKLETKNSQDENRTIEDILKEAEALINLPINLKQAPTISCESTPDVIKNNILDQYDYSTTSHEDDISDCTLLNEQLDTPNSCPSSPDTFSSMKSKKSSKSSGNKKMAKKKDLQKDKTSNENQIINQQCSLSHDLADNAPAREENDEKSPEEINFVVRADKNVCHSPANSMISSASWIRERELESTNENLQEKLKDTEERLQSLRIQYQSLSQVHRTLRENHMELQEETDKLKIDFQILNECGNALRCELQTVKQERDSNIEIQKILQQELEDNRVDKKKFQDIIERDAKTILDLQRQCKEMERILMRKHPDSVSALIVASNSNNLTPDSTSARKILEERIAQLEMDAKEQDRKAQSILANVQSRFKTVQAKYETHIQDLETQVLSLQQINLEQSKELAEQNIRNECVNISTQTGDIPEREKVPSRSVGIQTSNPPSRANSSQSINSKKNTKIPNSQSDSSIQPKDDAHLLATIRGMRIELAIKEKAVQRLSRELDDCKKTIKKLQKERDNYLNKEKPTATPKKAYNPTHYQENADSIALKDALEKIKVLENDFKHLYEKRLKDLKTLQNAHERELSASHETIRILQNREEHVKSMGGIKEKRRGPIDYYALKAKVTSLERRHSEREKSLHLLIDALSKGKASSLQTDMTGSPTESSSPHSCNSPVNKNL